MSADLILVSHHLCPYVQRAVIVAAEQAIRLERISIDLSAKPAWFTAVSPTGKVPLLRVGREVLFESMPIVEYLDEISPTSLHPADPLTRARHRAWAEIASAVLNDIAGLYGAADRPGFDAKRRALAHRFEQLEAALSAAPWFGGETFHIVDAVWAPVFRYFDVIEPRLPLRVLDERPRITRWREALRTRPSVAGAVSPNYADRLLEFLRKRPSHLGAALRELASAPSRVVS